MKALQRVIDLDPARLVGITGAPVVDLARQSRAAVVEFLNMLKSWKPEILSIPRQQTLRAMELRDRAFHLYLEILEKLPIKEVEERERIVRNNTSAIKHWGAFAGIAGASDKNAKVADWRSADASRIVRNGLRKMKALGLAGIDLAQADAPPVLAIRWPSRVNRSNFEVYFSDDAPIGDARSEWHNPEPFVAAFSSGDKPIPLVFVNAIVGGVTRACVVLIRKGKAHCEITAFAPGCYVGHCRQPRASTTLRPAQGSPDIRARSSVHHDALATLGKGRRQRVARELSRGRINPDHPIRDVEAPRRHHPAIAHLHPCPRRIAASILDDDRHEYVPERAPS
jgi:hypothetical protein